MTYKSDCLGDGVYEKLAFSQGAQSFNVSCRFTDADLLNENVSVYDETTSTFAINSTFKILSETGQYDTFVYTTYLSNDSSLCLSPTTPEQFYRENLNTIQRMFYDISDLIGMEMSSFAYIFLLFLGVAVFFSAALAGHYGMGAIASVSVFVFGSIALALTGVISIAIIIVYIVIALGALVFYKIINPGQGG